MASRFPRWRARPARAVTLLFVAMIAGCEPPRAESGDAFAALRVAVLPDESPELLRLRYRHLLDYMSSKTGRRTEFVIPSGYDDLLDMFHSEEVDLAWFGGVTFAKARTRSGAVPLVTRDIDQRFASAFIVASDAPERSIEDFRGAAFVFGPRLSTSGHAMPRFFLQQRGIAAEEFFEEVRHSSGHDETAYWVRDGVVSVGAANAIIIASMLRDGRLGLGELRILATTPPYQNYVWATRAGIDPALRLALLDAFLALDPAEPAHADLLAAVDASGFLPASDADFHRLRAAVEAVGLLRVEP